ncbi:AAA family ATPase [Candidatus Micrarchaeota archaeon]|nr:AAA family ATPase [Candidatus Micrarchaeota archaeon]
MNYFIIIRGPLGVGKSSIAKRLSKILEAEYVPIDLVLEKLGLDKVEKDVGCIPAANFIMADDHILPTLEKKLREGKAVIFDACFYHKEHIEHLIQHLPYPHYVFSLKAPLEVCIKRDYKRNKTHGNDAAAAVYQLVSRFDYGIVIDVSSKNINQTIKEILSYLPS